MTLSQLAFISIVAKTLLMFAFVPGILKENWTEKVNRWSTSRKN
jgi:hypothetical protein